MCALYCSGIRMDVAETEASHAESPVPKRSRGRPRKPPQECEEASAPRRPRGRPKGSKSKGQRVTARSRQERGDLEEDHENGHRKRLLWKKSSLLILR
ncbi:high mobility group AT-hook 2b isoform X3 [Triplophysa rosa]|uniref:high mobility group AT-hook 2b isoform X3 n=1 Tax=Triplophysa rosa TaxID=992332 RepID=UPI0025463639|nr:high mobility group AT-hook 2b isoform X3 [Triplophysa rosa]